MHKTLTYFIIGFVAGLITVELTNGKPPVNCSVREHPIGYDYFYRPLHLRSGVYQYSHYFSRENNSGHSRSGSNNDEGRTTDAGTQSFNHNSQERQESWGNKN